MSAMLGETRGMRPRTVLDRWLAAFVLAAVALTAGTGERAARAAALPPADAVAVQAYANTLGEITAAQGLIRRRLAEAGLLIDRHLTGELTLGDIEPDLQNALWDLREIWEDVDEQIASLDPDTPVVETVDAAEVVLELRRLLRSGQADLRSSIDTLATNIAAVISGDAPLPAGAAAAMNALRGAPLETELAMLKASDVAGGPKSGVRHLTASMIASTAARLALAKAHAGVTLGKPGTVVNGLADARQGVSGCTAALDTAAAAIAATFAGFENVTSETEHGAAVIDAAEHMEATIRRAIDAERLICTFVAGAIDEADNEATGATPESSPLWRQEESLAQLANDRRRQLAEALEATEALIALWQDGRKAALDLMEILAMQDVVLVMDPIFVSEMRLKLLLVEASARLDKLAWDELTQSAVDSQVRNRLVHGRRSLVELAAPLDELADVEFDFKRERERRRLTSPARALRPCVAFPASWSKLSKITNHFWTPANSVRRRIRPMRWPGGASSMRRCLKPKLRSLKR